MPPATIRWYGLLATLYYSMGTIPIQLGVALLLATLLFQDIWGNPSFASSTSSPIAPL